MCDFITMLFRLVAAFSISLKNWRLFLMQTDISMVNDSHFVEKIMHRIQILKYCHLAGKPDL